jgi:hypothetical protein
MDETDLPAPENFGGQPRETDNYELIHFLVYTKSRRRIAFNIMYAITDEQKYCKLNAVMYTWS